MSIQTSKIAACRFDYEYMGKTPTQLSHQYGYPLTSIEAEIKQSDWVRKLEPTKLPETKDIQEFASALEVMTRSKLSVISLFRQIENQPMIAELEKVFLDKALQLATALDPLDDKATTKLNNLVKAITTLQDRNPIDLAKQLEEASTGQGRVIVNIANMLQ